MLALEWDQFEARIVTATVRGGSLRIDHAFGVELTPREPGAEMDEQQIGQRLEAALAARGIRQTEALVAVGRSGIELRRLQLPPAPGDEVPDMVRMAALPEFSQLGDDWPLDFVTLEGSEAEGRRVLAAAISPKLVAGLNKTCDAAGIKAKRYVLRPGAAAALVLLRDTSTRFGVRLLVDRLAEEADLTVVADQQIALVRTVRLTGDDDSPQQARALVGEIRRTMAAAQNQLGGRAVEQLVLLGEPEEHLVLTQTLEESLELPVDSFQPLAGFEQSDEVRRRTPAHPGRFAPLLGMLLAESQGATHAIDFLNPRRRPDPPNRNRLYAILGTAAALFLLVIAGFLWWESSSLKSEIAELEKQIEETKPLVEKSQATIKKVREVDRWVESERNWMQELASLSDTARFPPPEDAMIDSLNAATSLKGSSDRITIDGHVRDTSVVPMMEQQLRQGSRKVDPGTTSRDAENERYPVKVREIVKLPPAADEAASLPNSRGPTARGEAAAQ